MRFALQVFDAVRAVFFGRTRRRHASVSHELGRGRLDLDQTIVLAKALDARGCSFIDVSSGGTSLQKITMGPGYQVPFARRQAGGLDAVIAWE